MNLSKRINQISPSPTLAITKKALEMKTAGIDIVSFGAGEPDFDTPELIRTAAKTALDDGFTHYTAVGGIPELKSAISDYILKNTGTQFKAEEIIATCGAKSAIFMALQVLLNEDDEVLIPAPYWVSYPEQVKLAGGIPKILTAREENNFKLTTGELESSITNRSKILIINTPSNPSGSVYSEKELSQLIEVCSTNNITIITDEIYDRLTYEGKFCSVLKANPKAKKNTIYINGLSKSFAMTGWRIGYAAGPAEVISAMTKYQGQLLTNVTSFVQKAAATALTAPDDLITDMITKFKERRSLILELLSGIPDITCVKPDGAFYVLPNVSKYLGRAYNGKTINTSLELSEYLIESVHVATVPGSAFGAEGYIRLSFATSANEIKKGVERIKEGLDKLNG